MNVLQDIGFSTETIIQEKNKINTYNKIFYFDQLDDSDKMYLNQLDIKKYEEYYNNNFDFLDKLSKKYNEIIDDKNLTSSIQKKIKNLEEENKFINVGKGKDKGNIDFEKYAKASKEKNKMLDEIDRKKLISDQKFDYNQKQIKILNEKLEYLKGLSKLNVNVNENSFDYIHFRQFKDNTNDLLKDTFNYDDFKEYIQLKIDRKNTKNTDQIDNLDKKINIFNKKIFKETQGKDNLRNELDKFNKLNESFENIFEQVRKEGLQNNKIKLINFQKNIEKISEIDNNELIGNFNSNFKLFKQNQENYEAFKIFIANQINNTNTKKAISSLSKNLKKNTSVRKYSEKRLRTLSDQLMKEWKYGDVTSENKEFINEIIKEMKNFKPDELDYINNKNYLIKEVINNMLKITKSNKKKNLNIKKLYAIKLIQRGELDINRLNIVLKEKLYKRIFYELYKSGKATDLDSYDINDLISKINTKWDTIEKDDVIEDLYRKANKERTFERDIITDRIKVGLIDLQKSRINIKRYAGKSDARNKVLDDIEKKSESRFFDNQFNEDLQDVVENLTDKELYKLLDEKQKIKLVGNIFEKFSLQSPGSTPTPAPAPANDLLILDDEFDFSNIEDIELFLSTEKYLYDNILTKLSNDEINEIVNIIEFNKNTELILTFEKLSNTNDPNEIDELLNILYDDFVRMSNIELELYNLKEDKYEIILIVRNIYNNSSDENKKILDSFNNYTRLEYLLNIIKIDIDDFFEIKKENQNNEVDKTVVIKTEKKNRSKIVLIVLIVLIILLFFIYFFFIKSKSKNDLDFGF